MNQHRDLVEQTGADCRTALTHLSVDATLHGPAVYWDVFLFVFQLVTFGHPDHLLHQVQASNTLCDWMLHLCSEGFKASDEARLHTLNREDVFYSEEYRCDNLKHDVSAHVPTLTCSRVFISRKKKFFLESTRNSTVPAEE